MNRRDDYQKNKTWLAARDNMPVHDMENEWKQMLIDICEVAEEKQESIYNNILSKLPSVNDIPVTAERMIKNWRLSKEIDYIYYSTNLWSLEGKSAVIIKQWDALSDASHWPKLHEVVYKFAPRLDNERRILNKINRYHDGHLRNTARIIDEFCEGREKTFVLALENVCGGVSSDILFIALTTKDSQSLIKDIGIDTLIALREMHDAGVYYHRDINPRNIVVGMHNMLLRDMSLAEGSELHTRTSTIIDYEYATDDKSNYIRDGNKRFNGPSDFSALAQTLFYLATRKSMFAPQFKPSDLSDVVGYIVNEREKAYSNTNGPEMRNALHAIDTYITYEPLHSMLNHLIFAKRNDHEKLIG